MKMRNIIPLVTGGTLLATLFGGSTLHAATKSKPNLVLVLVDDMGWGAFAPNHVDFTEKELNQEFCRIHVKDYTAEEAFEAAQKATPYLNRYCQEGVRFTNAYVTANVSAPSRAGLLTSSYQQRYGLYIIKEAETGIPTTVLTMPQVMKDYGYANGAFGKYHNGKGMDEIHTCSPWIGDSITGSGSIVMALLIIIHPYYSETGKTLHVRNILLISLQKKQFNLLGEMKGALNLYI